MDSPEDDTAAPEDELDGIRPADELVGTTIVDGTTSPPLMKQAAEAD